MSSPNYAALLQELWTLRATTTEPEQSELEGFDGGDIFQFLGEQLRLLRTLGETLADWR